MKAIVYTETGDPSVLQLVDREPSPPARARSASASSSPASTPPTGSPASAPATGQPPPFPEVTPNQDGAGVVDAVGEGSTDLAVGDRVWVYLAGHQRPTGTAQEYTNLPAARVVRLPDGTSFDIGASLGVPAMTAHRALTVSEDGPRRLHPGALAGKVVLVAGGAGAVGHAAIQLARWAGATVITTISSPPRRRSRRQPAPTMSSTTATRTLQPPSPRSLRTASTWSSRSPSPPTRTQRRRWSSHVRPWPSTPTTAAASSRLDVRANMIKNVRYQFVLLYTVGDLALREAVDDITRRSTTAPCPSAKTPACRCTGSRSPTPQTPTRPSRTARSARF